MARSARVRENLRSRNNVISLATDSRRFARIVFLKKKIREDSRKSVAISSGWAGRQRAFHPTTSPALRLVDRWLIHAATPAVLKPLHDNGALQHIWDRQ